MMTSLTLTFQGLIISNLYLSDDLNKLKKTGFKSKTKFTQILLDPGINERSEG